MDRDRAQIEDSMSAYRTKAGTMYWGDSLDWLRGREARKLKGKVQLVFTSPPFPLNRKKRYGNETGSEYLRWLTSFAQPLGDLLRADGSLVVEIGNAWEPGSPTMSTLPMRALLAFQEAGNFHLCQEFICFNPARLPSPAQWVTIERVRVKDSFTRLWWLSKSERPKADNRRVLQAYSPSMKRLLETGSYNAGRRPSEHLIGQRSFLKDNGGSIASNVLVEPGVLDLLALPNTDAADRYQLHCRRLGLKPHPARMPVALPSFFVKFLSEPGDLVLDPFAGSNTTGQAAEEAGRKWIGIEALREYAEASHSRFEYADATTSRESRPSAP